MKCQNEGLAWGQAAHGPAMLSMFCTQAGGARRAAPADIAQGEALTAQVPGTVQRQFSWLQSTEKPEGQGQGGALPGRGSPEAGF